MASKIEPARMIFRELLLLKPCLWSEFPLFHVNPSLLLETYVSWRLQLSCIQPDDTASASDLTSKDKIQCRTPIPRLETHRYFYLTFLTPYPLKLWMGWWKSIFFYVNRYLTARLGLGLKNFLRISILLDWSIHAENMLSRKMLRYFLFYSSSMRALSIYDNFSVIKSHKFTFLAERE